MLENITEFKDILKKARKEKGITQKQLASLSGLSFSMVSKLESGEQSNPSFDTIQKLASALGVSTSYLFGYNHIDLEYAPELSDFLTYLGYSVAETGTTSAYMADFDEEPTEDYLIVNDIPLNNSKIQLLEDELKRCIDFFLRLNKG